MKKPIDGRRASYLQFMSILNGMLASKQLDPNRHESLVEELNREERNRLVHEKRKQPYVPKELSRIVLEAFQPEAGEVPDPGEPEEDCVGDGSRWDMI